MYFGPVEVRNWQIAGQERVLSYPVPSVRLTSGADTMRAVCATGWPKSEPRPSSPSGKVLIPCDANT